MVYVLTQIDYEDDYKHRYDNGVYPFDAIVYKNREVAVKNLAQKQINDIIEYYCDCDDKQIIKKVFYLKQYWDKFDFDAIDDEFEKVMKGKFVKSKRVYDLQECKICDYWEKNFDPFTEIVNDRQKSNTSNNI